MQSAFGTSGLKGKSWEKEVRIVPVTYFALRIESAYPAPLTSFHEKMQSRCLFAFVALIACCGYFGVDASLQFKIEVLFKPTECQRTTKYGDQVFVQFNGTKFDTGEVFDKSHPDKPFRFQLGIGEVIDGFEEGLIDMCPGEKRRLTVPPSMAYGVEGGPLPQMPGGTVVFEVELVHTEEGPRHPNVFKDMDLDEDKHLSRFEVVHFLRKQVERAEGDPMSTNEEMRIANDIFSLEDIDKDGYISIIEFSGNKHDEL